jgi:hypothetical protein
MIQTMHKFFACRAGNTSQEIQLREICHSFRADPSYGIGVANALGIDLDQFIPDGAVQSESLIGKH